MSVLYSYQSPMRDQRVDPASALNRPTDSSSCIHSDPLSTVPSWNTCTKRTPAAHTWEGHNRYALNIGHNTGGHTSRATLAPSAGHRSGKAPSPASNRINEPPCIMHIGRKAMRKKACQ